MCVFSNTCLRKAYTIIQLYIIEPTSWFWYHDILNVDNRLRTWYFKVNLLARHFNVIFNLPLFLRKIDLIAHLLTFNTKWTMYWSWLQRFMWWHHSIECNSWITQWWELYLDEQDSLINHVYRFFRMKIHKNNIYIFFRFTNDGIHAVTCCELARSLSVAL